MLHYFKKKVNLLIKWIQNGNNSKDDLNEMSRTVCYMQEQVYDTRDQFFQMKDASSGTYQYYKDYQKELRIASTNVDTIFEIDCTRTQDREKAQDLS